MPPPGTWTLRTSDRSERVFAARISNNPIASKELLAVFVRLQRAPKAVGRSFRIDVDGREHWVFESAANALARLRIYFTTYERIVQIEMLDIV